MISRDPELLGNPIIGAVVAGGVSLAGLIVSGVAKKRQRKAEAAAVANQQKIEAQAAQAAQAQAQAKSGSSMVMIAALPVAALVALVALKKLKG